jgi:hypothetical protein
MINRYAIGVLLLAVVAWDVPRAGAATREQVQIKWDDLSTLVGQKVRVVMPDGARIEGIAKAVEVDALAIEISQTSDKAAYPKGKFLVPRATLKTVDVSRPTKKWRILCVSVGSGLGFLSAIFAGASTGGFINSKGLAAVFGAGAVAAPVGGYFIGRAADRRTISYVIAQ